MRIIELGCGENKVFPNSIGLDICKPEFTNLKTTDIIWDLNKVPWRPIKDSSFDLVICNEVVEHLKNIDSFLSETRRILTENGILVLTTNNKNSYVNKLFKTYNVSQHISLQDTVSIKTAVSKYFTIIKFFCLSYDKQSRRDFKFRTSSPIRRVIHVFLPESLRERMIIIAMKIARDLKRNCIGIEIEPKYIEITKKRLNWGSSLSDKIEWEFKKFD